MSLERIIELRWTCTSCGSKDILGRNKECPNCGSPREKGEMQMEGLNDDADGDGYNDNTSVVDPKLLSLANAGYDWFCTSCSAGNRGDGDVCSGCGASRSGDARERQVGDTAQLLGSTCEHCRRAMVLPGRNCPSCGRSHNTPRRMPATPSLGVEEEDYSPQKPNSFVRFGIAAVSVGILLLVAAVVFWSTRTKVVVGEVSEMTWTRTVHVDAWTQATMRDWSDQVTLRPETPPVNGQGAQAGYALVPGSCKDEFFKNEKYACGIDVERYDCSTYHTETERYSDTCYSTETERYNCGETCSSSGNGFAKCRTKTCTRTKRNAYSCTKTRTNRVRDPKTCTRDVTRYCTRPIYKERCGYQTQKWEAARAPTLSGQGREPVWPEANVGPLERSSREAKYTVKWVYTYRDRPASFDKILSEADYLGWSPGQPVWIEVNNLGMVTQYSPNPIEN